jgi:hypothetical protein
MDIEFVPYGHAHQVSTHFLVNLWFKDYHTVEQPNNAMNIFCNFWQEGCSMNVWIVIAKGSDIGYNRVGNTRFRGFVRCLVLWTEHFLETGCFLFSGGKFGRQHTQLDPLERTDLIYWSSHWDLV